MSALQQQLMGLSACQEALAWAKDYDDPIIAWRLCRRGDWLMWVAGNLGIEREALISAACSCVRLALPFTIDQRPLRGIEIAEGWAGRGRRPASIERILEAIANVEAACEEINKVAGRQLETSYAAHAALYALYATRAAFDSYAVMVHPDRAIHIATAKATAKAAFNRAAYSAYTAVILTAAAVGETAKATYADYTPVTFTAAAVGEAARFAFFARCASIVRRKIDEGVIMRLWHDHVGPMEAREAG